MPLQDGRQITHQLFLWCAAPPYKPDAAQRCLRPTERNVHKAGGGRGRDFGDERNARARCHHVPQCLKARCAKLTIFTRMGYGAYIQRLIAQAVTVIEQHK